LPKPQPQPLIIAIALPQNQIINGKTIPRIFTMPENAPFKIIQLGSLPVFTATEEIKRGIAISAVKCGKNIPTGFLSVF
jgi:hypothetical protein